MARLCERPGCSQPAEVIYGMSAERLTVWLEPFDVKLAARVGVLCLKHADAMIVPLGWLLDDRRETAPRLFKSPEAAPDIAPERPAKPRRSRHKSPDETGQLELMVPAELLDDEPAEPAEPAAEPAAEPDPTPVAEEPAVEAEPDPTPATPWKPKFDQTDDLDGLLTARSPLLSRAFRGLDRSADD